MTQQDDITQRVLTDSEILAIGAMHGRPSVALLPMFRAFEGAVLSKLRSSVAKPWPTEEQPDGTVTPVDPVDMASAPVADERVLTTEQRKEFIRRASYISEADRDTRAAFVDEIARASLASAPVAGEAQPGDYVQPVPDHCDRIVWRGRYYALGRTALLAREDAAPQASEAHGVDHFRDATQMVGASEAVRDAALEEAAAVAKRISDKYAFGLSSIESSTADEIEREILALKTQADKDGGQLRAGDVSAEAHRAALLEVERVGIELAGRLHEAAMSLETISQIAGRPGKDMETMDDVRGYAHSRARAARAAPSAPQAEQGEREDG
ncbi:hypothetical protein [Achromobacter xylosoxidans]|uniref:hypothetical protein n=1 Tax=Alcaligenes xylosoxydans xylosoxydans TaxID=85698 RepID=UPI0011DCDE3C|nr:hypothetical protein [Achromobacter xylosoxidans]